MEIKVGVNVVGLQPEIICVLTIISDVISWTGNELTITSALDGSHSSDSLHKKGLAIDIRLPYKVEAKDKMVALVLGCALGDDYDVVREKDHIHIEYDPK